MCTQLADQGPIPMEVHFFTSDASSQMDIDEFISESAIMAKFDHPNILKLLGVCFDTENGLPLIILPFVANGDLRAYLTTKRQEAGGPFSEIPKVKAP